MEITKPGIYDEMPPEIYHGDPVPGGSLSSGGARKLLPPSCPAKFRWWADNGQQSTPDFDFGHAAHKLILGRGQEVEVIESASWRTKAAQAAGEIARAAGKIPLLEAAWERAQQMETVLRAHPEAGPLFEPGTGDPEQSLFWQDGEFGVWRRARPDWVPHWRGTGGRLIIPDYKTCASAEPAALSRAMDQLGYEQQAAWYCDGAEALGLAAPGTSVFLFVCQEKVPPYVVTICQPDGVAMRRGRMRNYVAMSIYRECVESGIWPAYSDRIEKLPLPPWAETAFENAVESGEYDVLSRKGE